MKNSEASQRLSEPTPKFFKKLGRWALLVAAIAAAATPVFYAVSLPVIAGVSAAVSTGGVAAWRVTKYTSTERKE